MELGDHLLAILVFASVCALPAVAFLYFVLCRHRLLAGLRHIAVQEKNRGGRYIETALNMLSGVEEYGKAMDKTIAADQEYLQEPLRGTDAGTQLRRISSFIKTKVKPQASVAIDEGFFGVILAGAGESVSQPIVKFVRDEFAIDITLKSGRAFAEIGLPSWYESVQQVVPKLMDILAGKSEAKVSDIIAESLERLEEDLSRFVDLIGPTLAEFAKKLNIDRATDEVHGDSPLSPDCDWPLVVSLDLSPAGALPSLGRSIDAADDHAHVPLNYVDDLAIAASDDISVSVASGLADDLIVASTDDVAASIFGAGLSSIPVLPLITSSIREAQILSSNKTDLDTALGHILLDAAGAGGGAFAGATVGSMIFPGLGTLMGGIVGALSGRGVTNKIKRADLEKAVSAYKSTFRRATTAQDEAAATYHRELCEAVREARAERRRIIEDRPKGDLWNEAVILIAVGLLLSIHHKVDKATRELETAEAEALHAANRGNALDRLGLPAKNFLISSIEATKQQRRRRLEDFRAQLPTLEAVEKRPKEFLGWFTHQTQMPVVESEAARQVAAAIVSIVEIHTALLITWARMLAVKEREGILFTILSANKGSKKFSKKVSPYIRDANEKDSWVKREMDKLGMRHS